jgi:hypothetical protein
VTGYYPPPSTSLLAALAGFSWSHGDSFNWKQTTLATTNMNTCCKHTQCEDTETINRRRDNTVVKRREQQKMIYNTLHIDQIIEQHDPHEKPGVILGAPEGYLILLLQ